MKILQWHGYLLSGTGSNVYTANLARSWRAAGHDVLLLCQERAARGFPFVDAHGDFAPDNKSFALEPTDARAGPGRCRVLRPDIGGLLPVYVLDEYEGFEAKTFLDLSEGELDDYIERNVAALATAIEAHQPDGIVVGHEVMGPHIARLACEVSGSSYAVILHGSALEFAVKKQARYGEYAARGLGGARAVVGGSRHMVEAASAVVPGWEERAAVVNPGCDTSLFRAADQTGLARVPTVGFVGALIAGKGVHHFLAALASVHTRPLRAVIVGSGGFEADLHALAESLRGGDLPAALEIARRGQGAPLTHLVEWLSSAGVEERVGRLADVGIEFTGKLEHGPLSKLLPTLDVCAAPSVVPEAFGMVVAEAAACGVLPIVPAHSGIGEAGAALEDALDEPGLLTFDPARPIEGLASAMDRVLGLPSERRVALGRAAARFAAESWSWERIAEDILRLAAPR